MGGQDMVPAVQPYGHRHFPPSPGPFQLGHLDEMKQLGSEGAAW